MTKRRQRFAREYAIDLNGTQAAIRAGFSPRTASQIAYKLLRDPEVIAEVHKRLKALTVKADVTADRVLRELARIAFADITSLVRIVKGRVRIADTDALTVDQRAAIAEISETADGVRIKAYDPIRACELLGKRLALWTDRLELTGKPDAPLVVVLPPPELPK